MLKRNLVVFEDERVCPAALTYARELALRTDSDVTLLMLATMVFAGRPFLGSKRTAIRRLEVRVAKLLAELSAAFLARGISVTATVRMGDPAEELFKFLAERPPFHVLIWGSDSTLPAPVSRHSARDSHWLVGVADTLECPLFTVSSRTRRGAARPEDDE